MNKLMKVREWIMEIIETRDQEPPECRMPYYIISIDKLDELEELIRINHDKTVGEYYADYREAYFKAYGEYPPK